MFGTYELDYADDFEYTDPIDGLRSKQGVRFALGREPFIFRFSALVLLAQPSVCTSNSMKLMLPSRALMRKMRSRLYQGRFGNLGLAEFTGRESPTVITQDIRQLSAY